MHWHTVVSAFRVAARHDTPHTHVVGLYASRESTGELLAWTTSDLGRYPHAQFRDGTNEKHPTIWVRCARCLVCGEEIIRLTPSDVEERLPEASLGKPIAQGSS